MSKAVVLRDTKITIEIEARPLASGLLKDEAGDEKDHLFPYGVVTSIKVGDRPLGVVSRLSLAVEHGQPMPLLIVDLLGGAKSLAFELTPELKDSLAVTAAALRQFPFVQVNVPVQPIV